MIYPQNNAEKELGCRSSVFKDRVKTENNDQISRAVRKLGCHKAAGDFEAAMAANGEPRLGHPQSE